MYRKCRKQVTQTIHKEIVILKHAEYGEIHHHIAYRVTASQIIFATVEIALYNQATKIAAASGKRYQKQETPIPPAIKHIAGNSHKQILPLLTAKHKPVEQKHQRKKQYEWQRYKRHIKAIQTTYLKAKLIVFLQTTNPKPNFPFKPHPQKHTAPTKSPP